jgi:hypothetical protein
MDTEQNLVTGREAKVFTTRNESGGAENEGEGKNTEKTSNDCARSVDVPATSSHVVSKPKPAGKGRICWRGS